MLSYLLNNNNLFNLKSAMILLRITLLFIVLYLSETTAAKIGRNSSRPLEQVVVSIVACDLEENGEDRITSDCKINDIQKSKNELYEILPYLRLIDVVIRRQGINRDIRIHLEKHEHLVSQEVYTQVHGHEGDLPGSELYAHCYFGTISEDVITATFKLCGKISASFSTGFEEYELLPTKLDTKEKSVNLVLASRLRGNHANLKVPGSKFSIDKGRRKRDTGPFYSSTAKYMEIYMVINYALRHKIVTYSIINDIFQGNASDSFAHWINRYIEHVNAAASYFLEFNLHLRVKALDVHGSSLFDPRLKSLNDWMTDELGRNVSWFEKFYEHQKHVKTMHTISDVRLAWVAESYPDRTGWRFPPGKIMGIRVAPLPLCSYDSMAVVEEVIFNDHRTATLMVARALGHVIGLENTGGIGGRNCPWQCRRNMGSPTQDSYCMMGGDDYSNLIYDTSR